MYLEINLVYLLLATMFNISLKAAWQMLRGSGGAWAGGEGRVSLVFPVTKCKGPTQWAIGATELQTTQTSPALDLTRLWLAPAPQTAQCPNT